MNIKEKFTTAKEKIKPYTPELTALAITVTALTIGVIAAKKYIPTALGAFEPLAPVDAATRDQLLKNKDFLLYKLSENEYILDRPVPID